jgi:uncharacterized protein
MVTGLQKFAGESARQRGSSPKLQVLNTALVSAQANLTFEKARMDHEFWGHLTESAVGAYLANASIVSSVNLFYWRDRNREVDFIVQSGHSLSAIEVKSGRTKGIFSGLEAFSAAFKPKRTLLVGRDGIRIDDFLSYPIEHWIAE